MTSLGQFLKTVQIFENLTDEELDHLTPLFQIKNAKNKERVITEGDVSDLFYVIRTGHFNVSKGGKDTFIAALGPKDTFGEASLFQDFRRTAHVTAAEDGQLLLLQRDHFQQFLLTYPLVANRVLYQMLKGLFTRLEETSNELQGVRDGSHAAAEIAIKKILR